MQNIRFTTGEVAESIDIMQEAAQWLINNDKLLWHLDDLTPERLHDDPDAYIVMYQAQHSVATLLLMDDDPFIWPQVTPGESAFIHKLAVRRAFANTGATVQLIAHAAIISRAQGKTWPRLDCDAQRPVLCRFYEDNGFVFVGNNTNSSLKATEKICAKTHKAKVLA